MFQWNVEEMMLMNMPRENGIFACESEVSTEDKVSFVDQFQEGGLSYIFDLMKKFEADLPNLKKDEDGCVKTVSLQAWLRKNDHRNLIHRKGTFCGQIQFMGCHKKIYLLYSAFQFTRFFGYTILNEESFPCFVDECFHTQLEYCLTEEKKYYNENNADQKLIKEICDVLDNYGCSPNFDVGDDVYVRALTSFYTNEGSIELCYLGSHENDRDLTIEEVKTLKSALAPVEEKYQQLLKAKVEMEQALKIAGTEFANAIMN